MKIADLRSLANWWQAASELKIFVKGVDQVYEKPDNPDLVVKTVDNSIEESTMQVVDLLTDHVRKVSISFFCTFTKMSKILFCAEIAV